MTRTGKSTEIELVLYIWRIYNNNYKKTFASICTEARLGDVISESTLPLIVNEVYNLNHEKFQNYVDALKNAIHEEIYRSKIKNNVFVDYPALRLMLWSSNHNPPSDSAFYRRILPTFYSLNDRPTEDKKKTFNALLHKHSDKLGVLGDFTANYILSNNNCESGIN